MTSSRLTARGAATRDRIVRAAAELMYVRGVNATTLDEVRAASGVSKSQLYRHFADKEALVREVAALRSSEILDREWQRLNRLTSFNGLVKWRNALVQVNSLQKGAYGCVLGSMASELSDQDEQSRSTLNAALRSWEGLIADGLRRMQENGSMQSTVDADELSIGLMAALQGGYLLAEAARDIRPMEIALDMALDQVRTYLTPADQ